MYEILKGIMVLLGLKKGKVQFFFIKHEFIFNKIWNLVLCIPCVL